MELNKNILDAFSIKPKNIRKSKGIYIVETSDEKYKIRTVKIDEDFILKSQKVNDYLSKNDIKTTDCYKKSVNDTPFFIYRDETYVASKFLPLKPNDFSNKQNLLNTSSFLSKFHKALEKTDIEIRSKDLLTELKDNVYDLKSIRKKIMKQKTLKEFDLLFLKTYNIFLENMEKTIINLDNEYLKNRIETTKSNFSISHNNIKEENFELYDNEIVVNNFTKINVNDQFLDIASLIQRHLKSTESQDTHFNDVINEYAKFNALTENDIDIIKNLSKYPKRYLKTVFLYYQKNRSFTPTGLLIKLQEEIDSINKNEYFYK